MRVVKKWDYENTYNEAKKYKSRSEFKKGKLGAYKSACFHKWLDDYFWMNKPVQPYTIEQCIEIAKNVNQRKNIAKNAKHVIKKQEKWDF